MKQIGHLSEAPALSDVSEVDPSIKESFRRVVSAILDGQMHMHSRGSPSARIEFVIVVVNKSDIKQKDGVMSI